MPHTSKGLLSKNIETEHQILQSFWIKTLSYCIATHYELTQCVL